MFQKIERTVFGSLLEGASALGRLHPRSNPAKHGIEVLKDIAYKNTDRKEHLLDIYRPTKRQRPSPVVFYVHGGGFEILSKDSHWLMALIFAKFGYTVVTINYRLVPEGCFPIALQDTFDAYRWMVEHADQYDIDLERVVVAGESAGANLISALTIATCYQREELWARVSVGYVPDDSPYLEDDLANPLLFFEKQLTSDRPLPATFATCGTKDPLIDDTRRLVKALQNLKVTAEATYYKDGIHAFHAFIWLKIAKECWRDHDHFLQKHVGEVKVDGYDLKIFESLSK